ncbi:MAG: efflux RND transporter periplasmic adaptor subunit, partial [Armatimonadaceae bacterium]
AGGLAGMNAPLVRLVRTSTPEIRIDLDEIHLGKVKTGQEAVVASDAFPAEQFKARIRQVGAQVDTDRGTVEVRLTPVDPPDWLRPGQTLSVNIVVGSGAKMLVVPLTAVQTIGGDSAVYVVQGGKIARKPVKVGAPGADGFPIAEGLTSSDAVVVDPTGRKVGDSVSPVPAPKAKG